MSQSTPESPKKRFIESSSFYTNKSSDNPFSEMIIADSSFLDDMPSRSPCPVCNRSRKYYCYTCYVAVKEVASTLPRVNLPVQIDIIKHPKEVDGKSTSAHAALLAPDDVKIYMYPDFPSYENENVLLIFPGKSAISFQEWWLSNIISKTDLLETVLKSKNAEISSDLDFNPPKTNESKKRISLPFSRVIFIDSTWRQTKAMYNDIRLKNLPCVVLSSYKSLFWRYYRGKHETHLSTIEAVYYFLFELHSLSSHKPYCGEYDNMLFFFKFMYFKIRKLYDPTTLKAYQNSGVSQTARLDQDS